jgi:hypothetical protein
MTERFTALPWAVWLGVTAIVVTSTDNVVLLCCVTAGCWAAMLLLDGPRSPVRRAAVTASVALGALWAVLAVLLRRPGQGGPVVWLLPEWSSASGGDFGGPVTAGQLHLALARGCQGLAIVAMVALVAQAVSGGAWMRWGQVAWGSGVRVWGPMLCLGDAYVDQRQDVVRSRRSGFSGPGVLGLADLTDRARIASEGWSEQLMQPPSSVLRSVVGLVAVLATLTWWATDSIATDPLLPISGLERSLLALAILTAAGILLGRRLPPFTAADAVPLVSAGVLALAWFARARTGDASAIDVSFAELPSLPPILLLALAALPALSFAEGRRR